MGSSSSSLNVRSITADAGRLLDGREALIEVDGSRENSEVGGVLAEVPGVLWFLRERNFESLISIISSSASLSKLLFAFDCGAGLPFMDHFPSGSMVTWSTDFGVLSIMSLTYLYVSAENIAWANRDHSYSSTARVSNVAGLLQIGQSHVGPCS